MKFTSIFFKASAVYFRGLPQNTKASPPFHNHKVVHWCAIGKLVKW